MIAGTARFLRESKGRWAWATTFDARDFEKRGFAEQTIAGLQQGFKEEAIAVKIWKNIGMGIRGKSGEYLLPDNPALLPIYEAVLKAGKTLICHLAEPMALAAARRRQYGSRISEEPSGMAHVRASGSPIQRHDLVGARPGCGALSEAAGHRLPFGKQ